jgi:hypothetical protein
MVEVAGIEPASESAQLAESTYVAGSVNLAGQSPIRQRVAPASLYSLAAFPEARIAAIPLSASRSTLRAKLRGR